MQSLYGDSLTKGNLLKCSLLSGIQSEHDVLNQLMFIHFKVRTYTVSVYCFKLAVQATPWRKDLLKLLAYGVDHMEDQCIEDLEKYCQLMKVNVDCICAFYFEKNLETRPDE